MEILPANALRMTRKKSGLFARFFNEEKLKFAF